MAVQLYRALTRKEKICFSCLLPECYPTSEFCLFRQADSASSGDERRKWAWLYRRLARLFDGDTDRIVLSFPNPREARLMQNAAYRYRNRHLEYPPLTTWKQPVVPDDETAGWLVTITLAADSSSDKAHCTTCRGEPTHYPDTTVSGCSPSPEAR